MDELLSQYKKVLNDININLSNNNLINFNDKNNSVIRLISKENYDLKQKYESLTSTVRILQINVKLLFYLNYFLILEISLMNIVLNSSFTHQIQTNYKSLIIHYSF